jgi:hypothetical protein
MIGQVDDGTLTDGFIKAGPAATTFEFGITAKKRIATGCTIISAHFVKVLEFA